MNNQVTIAENSKTGVISTASTYVDKDTKEEKTHYKVMIKQTSFVSSNGYVNEVSRVAFITLDEKTHNAFDAAGLLVNGATLPLPGKIVVEEVLTFYTSKKGVKQKPKRAGAGKRIMTHKGMPIYRNTMFTQDMAQPDIFLKETPETDDEGDDAEE